MKFRQWYFGMAVAAAAFIPLAANADPVPNLINGASPGDILNSHFTGLTAENGNAFNPATGVGGFQPNGSAGANNGSCNTGLTACAETTVGAGLLLDSADVSKAGSPTLWTGGPGAQTGNPLGTVIGFVIYGIADQSVTTSGHNEFIDNTGATFNPTTGQAMDGKIHIDLYYMPGADAPCFDGSCGAHNVSAAATMGINGTSNSNVFGASATLFAAFTLQPGISTENSVDGSTSSTVTLAQQATFNTTTGRANGGSGGFFASCGTSGAGCSEFQAVEEQVLNNTDDPNYFTTLAQIFNGFDIDRGHNISTGNAAQGWQLVISDPTVSTTPVPEPASLGLLGTALAFLGVAIGRRRRNGISA